MSGRDAPALRRLGGKMLIGFGFVLAIIVALSLIGLDLRWAAVSPSEHRSEVLEQGVTTSLLWAAGAGSAVSLLGALLWLSGRDR